MFTHLTKTSWTTKVVLVLAAVAFLIPTFFVSATEDLSGLSGSELLPPPSGDFSTFPPPPDAEPAPPPNPNFPPVFYPPGFNSTNPQAQDGGQEFTTDAGNQAVTSAPTVGTYTPGSASPEGFAGESALKLILYAIVVNLFGTLVGWSGQLLNWAINDFVIGFGSFFLTTGVGVAVDQLWSLVRDFFNILFIFGFIWIGFQMILDSGNSRAKQTLVSLIMAALLINFSLFISKFVVDFSNRLASETAVAAFPAFNAESNVGDINANIRTQQVNIADTFFGYLGIPKTLDTDADVQDNTVAPWSYIFGSAIFYLIATFVFAAGALMLIIRFVALSIFMVLSPFMFLGWVFPGMQGWTGKYWKGFLGRAFYAPVYIILLFFAATILGKFFGDGGSMENDFILGGDQSNAISGILGAFALSCVFMIAAVQVAGKMSADGASGVMKVGGNIVRGGQRRLKNGALFMPRRAAQYGTVAAGSTVSGATNLARRTRLGRFATNNQLGAAAANAGQASKQVKYGAGSSYRDRQVAQQARSSKFEQDEKIAQAEKVKRDKKEHEYDDEDRAKIAAAVRAANDYSQKDIESMSIAQRSQITGYLKAGMTAKLLESDQLSSKEKTKIQGDYSAAIHDRIVENGEVVTDEISKLSVKQLEILGDQFVRDYAGFLSGSQMDDLKKSDAFTEQQKGAHIGARKNMLTSFGKDEAVRVSDPRNQGKGITISDTNKYLFKETKRDADSGVIKSGKSLKAVELAARPIEAYVNPETGQVRTEARHYLSADVLKQIARNSQQGKPTMSDDEREVLANAVVKTPGLNPRVYSYLTKDKAEEDFFMTKEMQKDAKTQEKFVKDPDLAVKDALKGDTLGM
jgi:hypothetical protein